YHATGIAGEFTSHDGLLSSDQFKVQPIHYAVLGSVVRPHYAAEGRQVNNTLLKPACLNRRLHNRLREHLYRQRIAPQVAPSHQCQAILRELNAVNRAAPTLLLDDGDTLPCYASAVHELPTGQHVIAGTRQALEPCGKGGDAHNFMYRLNVALMSARPSRSNALVRNSGSASGSQKSPRLGSFESRGWPLSLPGMACTAAAELAVKPRRALNPLPTGLISRYMDCSRLPLSMGVRLAA